MLTLTKKRKIDIVEGRILPNMIRYAIPIALTNLLQIFYHSADMFVIGNFCDDPNALGSIGCTTSMINLILSIFIGLGAGVSVTLARSIGAGDKERAQKVVHSSVLLALVLGAIVSVWGYFISVPILKMMNTQPEFFEGASKYVRIYFCGSIANLTYNFSAGILRSRGDTTRPLFFSMVGGVTNIILNVILVVGFGMGVEGVAIATIAAQFISATLIIIHMTRLDDECHLDLRRLRIDKDSLFSFIKIGVPAGIQSSFFSFSNMVLQTGYNSLGAVAVNANTAAGNVDSYIYNLMNSFYHTTLTFASQNYGARRFDRMKRVAWSGFFCVSVLGLVAGGVAWGFSDTLVGLFNSDPAVLAEAKKRLMLVALPYFICGAMEVGTALNRSLGYSFTTMLITFFGSCAFRVLWVMTVFKQYPKIEVLYLVYPVSWMLTTVALFVVFSICWRIKTREQTL